MILPQIFIKALFYKHFTIVYPGLEAFILVNFKKQFSLE